MEHKFDLIVVGCGIAGLATAVSAAESGLKVAVLERATIEDRGGNTRWTEALMRMKNETEVADDLEDHFMANSGFHLDPSLVQEAGDSNENRSAIVRSLGFTDPELISTLSSEAGKALTWLKKFGITYSDMPTYLITQSTTRLMPVGGGWALVEALVKAGENLGVKFFYETTAVKLIQSEDGTVCGLQASSNQTRSIKFMGKVMLACGGFEGNQEMQALYYGAKSRYIRPIARGSNTVDAIYENIARLINELPGGVSYVICDQKLDLVPNWQRTVRSDQKPITADTIEELANKLGIPSAQLVETVAQYNKATKKGNFKPLELDGLCTEGLTPPKSNWALPIDQGPYRAWPISSANCFTFGGLRCNSNAQVLDTDGRPISGLYAAGETMGLYYGKYTGATSVMRGLVFGRLAGQHAAQK